MKFSCEIVTVILWIGGCPIVQSQVTYTGTTSADTFLATGSSNNPAGSDLTGLNFGAAGILAIASPSSAKGEFQSVIKFNLSDAISLFNTTYGTNNWTINGISLEIGGNYGTAGVQPNNPIFNVISGGKFVIEWLSDDDWVEGTGNPNLPTTDGVTYNLLPALLSNRHEILCTNTYSPPGDNVHVTWPLPLNANLLADVTAGDDVSFLFYAADDQINYLFNSHNDGHGNEPLIHVTANPSLKILAGYFTNAGFHLNGLGGSNYQYQIQATTIVATTNWQNLGTITADAAGMIQFDDTTAANQPQRFYRLSH